MSTSAETFSFSGVEALQEGIKGAGLEPTQLKLAPVAGYLTFAQLGEATLSAGFFSGEVRVTGPMSDAMFTVGALLDTEGPNSQWSYETQGGDLAVMPPDVAHDGRYGARTSYAVLTLPLEHLAECCELHGHSIMETFWRQPAMYRPPRFLARQLVERLKAGVRTAALQPSILGAREAREAMLDDLLEPLLQGFAAVTEASNTPRRTYVSSSRTVEKVDDYLNAHANRPVRLPELCRYLNMSQRTLYRAFSEYLDLPPGLYMQRWRLTQVRTALTAPEDGDVKVGDVAARFGFWELGRFASDYRKMFGELPSSTLKNAQMSAQAVS